MIPSALNEDTIRLFFFLILFFGVSIAESFFPRKRLYENKFKRWSVNIGITIFNSLLLKLILPISAVGFAHELEHRHLGLLNQFELNDYFKLPLAVVFLDFIIYLQHRLFHANKYLWKLHSWHHKDKDFDVTTGSRFHSLEIVISMGIKFLAILIIGASPLSVITFEIILSSMALFNHGNFYIPISVDRQIRKVIVTPDMHRVHHSIYPNEHHCNFGFNLSIWDILLGTYLDQPKDGHKDMKIGL